MFVFLVACEPFNIKCGISAETYIFLLLQNCIIVMVIKIISVGLILTYDGGHTHHEKFVQT